ncbi:MAG: phosphoadenosine phosphosulfate reductase family protein [Thermodesulfobacterium sp.]|jgi:DNA sulfur modification protein DndC|nr:phosphoadenosine phosphosulfate reductase family protein [Thermodesulfobacterium sp.]
MENEILIGRLKKLFSQFLGQPVVVAYSGGKDSTFLLHHVLVLLKEMRSNPLVVVYADTLVENPVVHQHVLEFLGKVEKYCEETGIDVRILIAQPELNNTFWVNIIGKGYPVPSPWFRWCQEKLKIKPVKKVLEGLSEGIMLVAVREQESKARQRSLQRRLNGMELERNHLRVFAPIFDFTNEDIWEFLTQAKSPWGEDYSKVISLYSGCGTRFGCWVCTVVKEDKTLKNQAQFDEVLKKLYEFRNWLLEFSFDPKNRLPIRRNGKPAKNSKGVLSLKAREEILRKLQELEKETNMQILSPEELEEIRKIWEKDKKRFSSQNPSKA